MGTMMLYALVLGGIAFYIWSLRPTAASKPKEEHPIPEEERDTFVDDQRRYRPR